MFGISKSCKGKYFTCLIKVLWGNITLQFSCDNLEEKTISKYKGNASGFEYNLVFSL